MPGHGMRPSLGFHHAPLWRFLLLALPCNALVTYNHTADVQNITQAEPAEPLPARAVLKAPTTAEVLQLPEVTPKPQLAPGEAPLRKMHLYMLELLMLCAILGAAAQRLGAAQSQSQRREDPLAY
ncbi:unnamed protein product, partial [Effrenium voratum]